MTPTSHALAVPRSDTQPLATWPVLVVDDDPDVCEVMASWVAADGCEVLRAASARDAVRLVESQPVSVALCDVNLPDHDGFWFAEALHGVRPDAAVVLVTGYRDVDWALRGLQIGAVDYLLKPFDQRAFSRALEAGLRQHRERRHTQHLQDARALELADRHARLVGALTSLAVTHTAEIRATLDLLAFRQDDLREHSRRVATLSVALATAVRMPSEQIVLVEHAALLHEVGRLVLPDSLLTKTGELSADDRAYWRRVPTLAASMLEAVPTLKGVAAIVRSRFEEFSGGGYPRQLVGPQIPLASRVLAVADSYDAMRSPRPFRDALNHAQADAELRRGSGTQFDPELVTSFLRLPHLSSSTSG
jgi:putative two-component system response regulator